MKTSTNRKKKKQEICVELKVFKERSIMYCVHSEIMCSKYCTAINKINLMHYALFPQRLLVAVFDNEDTFLVLLLLLVLELEFLLAGDSGLFPLLTD